DHRAAETVDAEDGRRDDGDPRGARLHRDHLLADRDVTDASPRDRGRLRRPVENGGDQQHGCRGDTAAYRWPSQRDAKYRTDEKASADTHGGDDAEGRRPQMHADADERLAARVLLDERTHIEPCPASDRETDVAVVGPAFVDHDRADGA